MAESWSLGDEFFQLMIKISYSGTPFSVTEGNKNEIIKTQILAESVLRLIKSSSCHVRLYVCVYLTPRK